MLEKINHTASYIRQQTNFQPDFGIVLGSGGKLALIGIAVGLAASFALTSVVQSVLFGVTATDPLTFSVAAAGLALVALIACLLPALRAIRVDPVIALRYE